ncbi:unnamed protein product [Amoebophrya sp. A120]|nr:unnamed protein product [Amoebophrya sp. A120]|eukprot:GSA120T00013833001.1
MLAVSKETGEFPMRCCGDEGDPPSGAFPYKDDAIGNAADGTRVDCRTSPDDRCSASGSGRLSYAAAVAKCAETNRRLCTSQELLTVLNGQATKTLCSGTGGNCDNACIWTSTVPYTYPVSNNLRNNGFAVDSVTCKEGYYTGASPRFFCDAPGKRLRMTGCDDVVKHCVGQWDFTDEQLAEQCIGAGETRTREYDVSQAAENGGDPCSAADGDKVTYQCPLYQCKCTFGEAETGPRCVTQNDGTQTVGCDVQPGAAGCNAGYHPVEKTTQDQATYHVCEVNKCNCPSGNPAATGVECAADGSTTLCTDCTEPGYHMIEDGQNKECTLMECTCEHGEPDVGAACDPHLTVEKCVRCTADGYHLDLGGTNVCVENECLCDNGTGAKGAPACMDHGAEVCAVCVHAGFRLENQRCLENVCRCNHGTEATGADCTEHHGEICKECTHPGFSLDVLTKTCVQNICTCAHGIAATEERCTANNTNICTACTEAGYKLNDATESCVQNICTCANGTAATGANCTEDGANICSACSSDTGFSLDEGAKTCVQNVCTCANGTAATGGDCKANNTNTCADCADYIGFSLDEVTKSCVQNICTCANGTPATGEDCTRNGTNICTGCEAEQGFSLDENSAFCVQNVCTCVNGTAATGGNCTSNNTEVCESCLNEDEFKLTEDKHCIWVDLLAGLAPSKYDEVNFFDENDLSEEEKLEDGDSTAKSPDDSETMEEPAGPLTGEGLGVIIAVGAILLLVFLILLIYYFGFHDADGGRNAQEDGPLRGNTSAASVLQRTSGNFGEREGDLKFEYHHVNRALIEAGLSALYASRMAQQICDMNSQDDEDLVYPTEEHDKAILQPLGLEFDENDPDKLGRMREFLQNVAKEQRKLFQPLPKTSPEERERRTAEFEYKEVNRSLVDAGLSALYASRMAQQVCDASAADDMDLVYPTDAHDRELIAPVFGIDAELGDFKVGLGQMRRFLENQNVGVKTTSRPSKQAAAARPSKKGLFRPSMAGAGVERPSTANKASKASVARVSGAPGLGGGPARTSAAASSSGYVGVSGLSGLGAGSTVSTASEEDEEGPLQGHGREAVVVCTVEETAAKLEHEQGFSPRAAVCLAEKLVARARDAVAIIERELQEEQAGLQVSGLTLPDGLRGKYSQAGNASTVESGARPVGTKASAGSGGTTGSAGSSAAKMYERVAQYVADISLADLQDEAGGAGSENWNDAAGEEDRQKIEDMLQNFGKAEHAKTIGFFAVAKTKPARRKKRGASEIALFDLKALAHLEELFDKNKVGGATGSTSGVAAAGAPSSSSQRPGGSSRILAPFGNTENAKQVNLFMRMMPPKNKVYQHHDHHDHDHHLAAARPSTSRPPTDGARASRSTGTGASRATGGTDLHTGGTAIDRSDVSNTSAAESDPGATSTSEGDEDVDDSARETKQLLKKKKNKKIVLVKKKKKAPGAAGATSTSSSASEAETADGGHHSTATGKPKKKTKLATKKSGKKSVGGASAAAQPSQMKQDAPTQELLNEAQAALMDVGFSRHQAKIIAEKIAGVTADQLDQKSGLTEEEKKIASAGLGGAKVNDLQDLAEELVHQKGTFFAKRFSPESQQEAMRGKAAGQPMSLLEEKCANPGATSLLSGVEKKTKGKRKVVKVGKWKTKLAGRGGGQTTSSMEESEA